MAHRLWPKTTSNRLTTATLVAIAFAAIACGAAQARAQYPYTLVDPGAFGGPQSFLNLPAVPMTPDGALLGTADTAVPDADYPNFNPFMVGFPDPYIVHAFVWQGGRLRDLGALPGNNSSAVFELNGDGVGVGIQRRRSPTRSQAGPRTTRSSSRTVR